MNENNRCSTLFHLLVPGGKGQTEIERPVSSANFCNSNFQSRNREPLLPPPSAVTSNARASEYKALPWLRHHPRMDATANAPVSWSPSRPGELHPEPLTDPDLSLSTHPARATP